MDPLTMLHLLNFHKRITNGAATTAGEHGIVVAPIESVHNITFFHLDYLRLCTIVGAITTEDMHNTVGASMEIVRAITFRYLYYRRALIADEAATAAVHA